MNAINLAEFVKSMRNFNFNAYVQDFTILQIMADGDKVVPFEENPTKSRQGGLQNKTRSFS